LELSLRLSSLSHWLQRPSLKPALRRQMATIGVSSLDLYDKETEPSNCRKMKRFRLTHNQSRYLMSEFARQAHPDAAHRERLSKEIPGLSPRQVQVWFQNRRAKLKRMSSDDRYHMMKSRALPEEFPILQTLYTYDLACASKTRPSRSDSSCSSQSDRRDFPTLSPQNSDPGTGRVAGSSVSYSECQNGCLKRVSCEISPITPSCTLQPFQGTQEGFSSQASVLGQPCSSYFEKVSTYRTSGYIFPSCPISECRSTRTVGDMWQSREAQSMPMFPNWRPTLNTLTSDPRNGSASPISCSSTPSDEYLSGGTTSHHSDGHPRASHVFDIHSAPRIVPSLLISESMFNMYDKSENFVGRKGNSNKRSLSQPNVDIRS